MLKCHKILYVHKENDIEHGFIFDILTLKFELIKILKWKHFSKTPKSEHLNPPHFQYQIYNNMKLHVSQSLKL